MVSGDPRRFELSGRELALIFLFWTSLALLSSANRLIDARDVGFSRVISPTGPITLAFIEAWTWALFTPAIFWLSSRSIGGGSRWIRFPLLLLVGVAIAIAVYLILEVSRHAIIPVPPRRRGGGGGAFMPLREIGRFRFLNQMIVYLAVLAAGFAREYFKRDQHRQREAMVQASETAALQAQLAEARLDALRMQLNPHFLFNTLHAVSALVERDPSGVRRMISRLSDLLRHTIDSHAADEVPLSDELGFLKRYIEIMEVRFQGKLQVEVEVPLETQEALVPNLVLQPIVENALEHGVNRRTGEGHVRIEARRDGEALTLIVTDNGPGLEGEAKRGVGLTNTRARLEQLYGDAASLTIVNGAEAGAVATVTIPWHTARDLRAQELPS
jgi:two-component system, LytTR family, sensor kinase